MGGLLQRLKKREQRRVRLGRPLLVNPVPGTRHDRAAAKVGARRARVRIAVDAGDERPHRIALTGDEARGLSHRSADDVGRLRGVEGRRPVAVERTDHAGALEARSKRVEVGVGDEAQRTVGRVGEQREECHVTRRVREPAVERRVA